MLLGDELISSIAICCSLLSAEPKCSMLCLDVKILHSSINFLNASYVKFANRVLRSENSFLEIEGRTWNLQRDFTERFLLHVVSPFAVGVGLYLEAICSWIF